MNVLPLKQVALACSSILDEQMRPIHYSKLTELVLERCTDNPSQFNFNRQKEDIREKVLQSRRLGMIYLPKPNSLAIKLSWMPFANTTLLEPILLPGIVTISARLATEIRTRTRYMKDKNKPGFADPEIPTIDELRHRENWRKLRVRALWRGLVTENHFREWYKKDWLNFYLDPPNIGRPRDYCHHDFSIIGITSKPITVDIECANEKGQFGTKYKKVKADLFFQCSLDRNKRLWWHRSVPRNNYKIDGIGNGQSPARVCFVLNCRKYGIDRRDIEAQALSVTKHI